MLNYDCFLLDLIIMPGLRPKLRYWRIAELHPRSKRAWDQVPFKVSLTSEHPIGRILAPATVSSSERVKQFFSGRELFNDNPWHEQIIQMNVLLTYLTTMVSLSHRSLSR